MFRRVMPVMVVMGGVMVAVVAVRGLCERRSRRQQPHAGHKNHEKKFVHSARPL